MKTLLIISKAAYREVDCNYGYYDLSLLIKEKECFDLKANKSLARPGPARIQMLAEGVMGCNGRRSRKCLSLECYYII